MGLPDDNPSSFGHHCGIVRHVGFERKEAVGKIWHFLSNFSAQNLAAQNLLINSHQAHQIAAHPFHHVPMPMGLPDDNPSSFGHHCGIGRHAGLEGLA
jgi:hypothetical protein